MFSVSDTGTGVASSDLSRIWDQGVPSGRRRREMQEEGEAVARRDSAEEADQERKDERRRDPRREDSRCTAVRMIELQE